jgi:hypothetical protein
LAFSVFLLASSLARASVISNFEVGSEGWTLADIFQPIANPPTIIGGGSVIYETAEGNPAGSIATADVSPNATFFMAPAKFLGDASSAFGTTFSYDMRLQTGVGQVGAAVMMVGGGLTLLGGAGNVPTEAWETFGVDLIGASFNVNARTGPTATDAQLQQVLGSLTALYIQPDVNNGPEFAYLDNVVLKTTVVPLPATLPLFGTALAGLGLARWRNRTKMKRAKIKEIKGAGPI